MQKVGQASYDLLRKPDQKINIHDMKKEMQKSVSSQIDDIIKNHINYSDEYYIVYMIQRERTMSNVIRQKFIVRKTRPFPDYDCSLFSYDNKKCELFFHWALPDEETCEYLMQNKSNIRAEEKELWKFVKKFVDGKLF